MCAAKGFIEFNSPPNDSFEPVDEDEWQAFMDRARKMEAKHDARIKHNER